ncbi:MAG: 4-hydroxy-tetrahydrodipicolinate reductase [Methyloligellaceae bacterium]
METFRIAVMGAAGRMGRSLIQSLHENPATEIAGGTEPEGSAFVGQDLGELAGIGPIGVAITDDPLPLFTDIHGVVDFTTPEASLKCVELAAQARIVHVLGTTGLSPEDDEKILAAARHARIVKAGNMSLGVNLLTALTKQVAKALDEDFDIEILEMHHKHKVDAPSGTALMLGEAAAEGRDIPLDQHSVRSRDGHTGARTKGEIGFATLRGGNVVGEHSVIFATEGERIVLNHIATDRGIFARGAVKAAVWGQDKSPGLYSMFDVLGIEN